VSQDSARVILHVDMDAFFASVELLRHPELRGLPVVVGGTGDRGVVAAASYEARSYGVYSAMSSVQARRLCPDAVFLQGDHAHYSRTSAVIMEIFRTLTPLVEPLSLDEAFLDISGSRRLLGEPLDVAQRLRCSVKEETGLSCSLGIAPNKFLAKLATTSAKPTASRGGPIEGIGVAVVAPGEELEFLHPLPVERLWGVGPATLAKLAPLGVATIGDLSEVPQELLQVVLGPGAGAHLHQLSLGRDNRPVVANTEPKSMSQEQTFAQDISSMDALRSELVRQSEAVASRLRHHGYRGRTVQLKVRYRDFTTVTRSQTLETPTDRGTDLVRTAWSLLLRLPVERGVRLLGVGVANLLRGELQQQLSFDDVLAGMRDDPMRRNLSGAAIDAADAEWDATNSAVDAIRNKFGAELIGPARLAGQAKQAQGQQWGPAAEPDADTASKPVVVPPADAG
jgi:DNA polymerase-4